MRIDGWMDGGREVVEYIDTGRREVTRRRENR